MLVVPSLAERNTVNEGPEGRSVRWVEPQTPPPPIPAQLFYWNLKNYNSIPSIRPRQAFNCTPTAERRLAFFQESKRKGHWPSKRGFHPPEQSLADLTPTLSRARIEPGFRPQQEARVCLNHGLLNNNFLEKQPFEKPRLAGYTQHTHHPQFVGLA